MAMATWACGCESDGGNGIFKWCNKGNDCRRGESPNPWQQLLAAARSLTIEWAAGPFKDMLGKGPDALVSAVKALEGASVPTMQAGTGTCGKLGCSDPIMHVHFKPLSERMAAIETCPSESQKRLGLRSARYVNQTPWDSDID